MILMFEKLDMSLLDLLKIANFQGFTLNVIAKFGEQILNGLKILKRKKIVHCDLKPENILLMKYIFDTNPTLTPLALALALALAVVVVVVVEEMLVEGSSVLVEASMENGSRCL